MIATGTPTSSAPAMSTPQKYTAPPISSVATPSGTGFCSEMDTKASEYRTSCMDSVNEKITAVITPGQLTGSTTRSSAPNWLHPSIIAASSISNGTVLKNPMRSHVQNGIVKVGYTTTSDHQESWRWSSITTRGSGMNRMMADTRYVMKMAIPRFSANGR